MHPYCARFFGPLAHANERVHEHNEINFPQAKLNSEINVSFLLNGHGNLSFLLHNNGAHTVLLNLKKTVKFYGKEKKIQVKECTCKNSYSVMMQVMTAKTTTLRTLHVHAVLNFKCDVSIFFSMILF